MTDKSQRNDGRGHWAKGKRRNASDCDVPDLLLRFKKYIDSNRQAGSSIRTAAAAIGVHPRTLARWIAGKNWPPLEHQKLIMDILFAGSPGSLVPLRAMSVARKKQLYGERDRHEAYIRSCEIAGSSHPQEIADARYHGPREEE